MQRVFAIARVTLKAAFRYRLVQILTVLLLGAVIGLPLVIKHDDNAAMEAEVEQQLQARLKDSKVAGMDRDFVRKQIRERVKAQFQVVPPGGGKHFTVSTGLLKERLQDKPLQLRIKFFVAQGASS